MIGKYLGHAAALSKQAVELDNPSSHSDCPRGAESGVRGRSGARPPHPSGRCQPEISLWPDPTPTEILRGLARSAIGMRRVSTPAS